MGIEGVALVFYFVVFSMSHAQVNTKLPTFFPSDLLPYIILNGNSIVS